MKAVLQYRASTGFRTRLLELTPDWLRIAVVEEHDRIALAREMLDAEVLLHVLEPVTAQLIDQSPRLRLIQKIGVGVNTIDLEAARRRGIAVANMPGTNSQAVAEMTLTLMLAALRRLPQLDRAVRAGQGWNLPRDSADSAGEVAGRVVGLIGYGEVPRRLAPVLLALGATLLYTSREPKADAAAQWRSLPQLLAQSDVVSLHLPLAAATERIMDAAAFRRMKRGAVLINTARGQLVDEDALVSALRSGHLAAAGLDVYATEPLRPDHPLLDFDNVVVSPHVAWLTPETLRRSLGIAIDNCARLRTGESLLHQILP